MHVVFFVLEREEYLEEILEAFLEKGIPGATVLQSTGMGKIMAEHCPIFIRLRSIITENNLVNNHTIFVVVEDELVVRVLELIEEVVGDLEQPGTGVFFSLPVARAKGFGKLNC